MVHVIVKVHVVTFSNTKNYAFFLLTVQQTVLFLSGVFTTPRDMVIVLNSVPM